MKAFVNWNWERTQVSISPLWIGSNSLHKGSIEILHTYAFGDVTKLETPQSKETRKAYLEDFFRKLGPRQAVLEWYYKKVLFGIGLMPTRAVQWLC